MTRQPPTTRQAPPSPPLVMAVTFEEYGQLHYLRTTRPYRVGDWVLYPTSAGPEVARVVWAPEPVVAAEVADAMALEQLPECPGPASQADLDRDAESRRVRAEALLVARRLVADHELDMKVLAVDALTQDGDDLVAIYYTAPERVDFRALVPDLARALQARIDLRQVGARDAASLLGGIGNCGRDLCCSTFLTQVEPVSMRLVKVQGLPVNPLQISGACGKLMCCLKYEHPLYADFTQRAPAVGEQVSTPEGSGTVVGHQVPAEQVLVRGADGEVRRCPLVEVCPSSRKRKQRTAALARRRRPQPPKG